MRKIKNIQDVVKSGLCNRCGTCVGLSDGKIVFSDRTKKFLPQLNGDLDANENAELLKYCSGKGFDFPAQNRRIYGCLLYTSPSPRDRTRARMPSSA